VCLLGMLVCPCARIGLLVPSEFLEGCYLVYRPFSPFVAVVVVVVAVVVYHVGACCGVSY